MIFKKAQKNLCAFFLEEENRDQKGLFKFFKECFLSSNFLFFFAFAFKFFADLPRKTYYQCFYFTH